MIRAVLNFFRAGKPKLDGVTASTATKRSFTEIQDKDKSTFDAQLEQEIKRAKRVQEEKSSDVRETRNQMRSLRSSAMVLASNYELQAQIRRQRTASRILHILSKSTAH